MARQEGVRTASGLSFLLPQSQYGSWVVLFLLMTPVTQGFDSYRLVELGENDPGLRLLPGIIDLMSRVPGATSNRRKI